MSQKHPDKCPKGNVCPDTKVPMCPDGKKCEHYREETKACVAGNLRKFWR